MLLAQLTPVVFCQVCCIKQFLFRKKSCFAHIRMVKKGVPSSSFQNTITNQPRLRITKFQIFAGSIFNTKRLFEKVEMICNTWLFDLIKFSDVNRVTANKVSKKSSSGQLVQTFRGTFLSSKCEDSLLFRLVWFQLPEQDQRIGFADTMIFRKIL